LRRLLILLVILAAAVGLDYGANAFLFAPWAYGIFGRATLTGSWNGTLKTHDGVPYAVRLQLSRSSQALSGRLAPDIQGKAAWCAPGIRITTSTVTGTADRSASNVRLNVSESGRPPRGLSPSQFQGAWHGSALVLHVLFQFYNGHAYVESASYPDEFHAVTLTLHKGGENAFRAACARI
jgi:hypothetical protein